MYIQRKDGCIVLYENSSALHVALFFSHSSLQHTGTMQDNDPKHTSKKAKLFYQANGINWWPTPPQPPDLNPIENLWHEMKKYLHCEVKTRNKPAVLWTSIVS